MKGLKVKMNGQTVEIAVPEGNASVIVGCHDGKYALQLIGTLRPELEKAGLLGPEE